MKLKKIEIAFKTKKLSIKTVSGRKTIVKETLKKDYNKQNKELISLKKSQDKLAKLKTQYRKLSKSTEKKALLKKIKTYDKYVTRKFNKVLDIKKTKDGYTQKSKSVVRVTKRGLVEIDVGKKVKVNSFLAQKETSNLINDYEEFINYYTSQQQDLKTVLTNYGVTDNFNDFVGIDGNGNKTTPSSVGWIRRTMNGLGISDSVSTDEFCDWLIKAGVGAWR